MWDMTKFTLVIPTYNEASIIRQTLSEIVGVFASQCAEPWSIIVVDNASTDNTVDVVRSIRDLHIRVLRLEEKGRGRALRAAFAAAGEGVVAFTDADLPIDPENILQGLSMIQNGECEIVVGTRVAGQGTAKRPLKRRLGTILFHVLSRVIVGLHASDSQCPLRIMNERVRPIMLATVDPTWWSELEFLVLAEKLGISVKEIAVDWNEERYPQRKSSIRLVRDGFRAIHAMLRMRSYLTTVKASLEKELSARA